MTYKYYIKLLLNLCPHVLCFKILTKHSCNKHGKLAHRRISAHALLCRSLRHAACRHESFLLRNMRKQIYMKKNNNSTPMFISTFPPHTSIFVNSLKQHARSQPLTDSHLQANPLDYSTLCKCVLREAAPAQPR